MRISARLLVSALALVLNGPSSQAQGRNPEFGRSLAVNLGAQARVMWVDGTANLARTTTAEGVRDIVERCRRAKFNLIVVDVKPIVGRVLYDSRIAPRLTEWQGASYPAFDVLAAFVEEGKRAGIEIAAALNVFSEGHKYVRQGQAFDRPEWQSLAYLPDRALIAPGGERLSIRAAAEAEEPGRAVVFPDSEVLPTSASGDRLNVMLDSRGGVEGFIAPELSGPEPLAAPEKGFVLPAEGSVRQWVEARLRAGDASRFQTTGRYVKIADSAAEAVAAFVNPLHPEARAHQLALLREIAEKYEIGAIVFDRMRYAGSSFDFSDTSRAAFEKWLGRKIAAWPDEVIRFPDAPAPRWDQGPLYRSWLEFRAGVIRDFLREAGDMLRQARPGLQLGAYVGSWFRDYYSVGVNWASEKYPVRLAWATPTYNEAGYLEFLDWITTGCYYPVVTRAEARAQGVNENLTVEAAAELSMTAAQNAAPVYAGIYALDYARRPEDFARALNMAAKQTYGVMVFDVSHIYQYDWWPLLEKAFPEPAEAPHAIPGISLQLRTAQDSVR